MAYLLLPGRHHLFTAFQQAYVHQCMGLPLSELSMLSKGTLPSIAGTLEHLVLAITSANQAHSRYNPIAFVHRAIGADRFAGQLARGLGIGYSIVGIPHYPPTERFAELTLKELAAQTEGRLQLTPANTVVMCSTPAVLAQYAAMGFAILPAELEAKSMTEATQGAPHFHAVRPGEQLGLIADAGAAWHTRDELRTNLSLASHSLLRDFPEIAIRAERLWHDPLLTQSGSLTTTRDYSTYAYDMSNPLMIAVKYEDIKAGIRPGKIVDEGCADGALFGPIAQDFPDSDLIGIEITEEFLARANERKRAGYFGQAFVHFYQRNILQPIFEANSIDTTICNSTAHELWSYGEGRPSLMAYLKLKFEQLKPGGRLVIRDVVGPEAGNTEVLLALLATEGADEPQLDQEPTVELLEGLSGYGRFRRFAHDFLPQQARGKHQDAFLWEAVELDGQQYIRLKLKDAAEFIFAKDYLSSWASEMHEAFAFWAFSDWQAALEEVGFKVLVDSQEPEKGSRTYLSEWIKTNRLDGQVALYKQTPDGSLQALPYPPSNIVLFAEKPAT